MIKAFVFDMDGTVADFYSQANWLEDLHNECVDPYLNAEPLVDMVRLVSLLERAQALGIKIIIDTWLAKDSSEAFKDKTREAKRTWLEKYDFPFDKFHGIQYGTTKADSVRRYLDGEAILFDDNDNVRKGWHLGEAINPLEIDIVNYIEKVLG